MQTNLTLTKTESRVSPLGFLWRMAQNPLDLLTDLAREHGDIAPVRFRWRRFFLLNHPEFIEQVLVRQAGNFVKGPGLKRARVILGEGLLTSEGEQHLAQRRALQPAFHRHKMEEYLPVMNENTISHLSSWAGGTHVDMAHEMMKLTLNIALWSFFGSAPAGSVERVSASMKTLSRLFPLTQFPLPDAARLLFPKFRQARDDLNSITKTLLAAPGSNNALIHILKQNSGGHFTEEQVSAHALTFLLAGHETTALLLTWCWDLLAHHPLVQNKLQDEVDRVLGNRFPAPDDVNNLPYTRSIVKETLRMRPPAWAMGRQALNDCQIGGQSIHAGDVVILSQWVTHHDARFYEYPDQFHPERWPDLEKLPFPRYAFFPFGGGNRVCIGEQFAMTEAIAVLALIARRWHVLPAQADLARPKPSVTLRPNKGVKLILERRDV